MTKTGPNDRVRSGEGDGGRSSQLRRHDGWKLCGADLDALDDLHAIVRTWLPLAENAADVRALAACLDALEAIACGEFMKDALIELDIVHRPDRGDGMSVVMHFQRDRIELASTEWVFMTPDQGHDRAYRTHATLTPSGNFDHAAVSEWIRLASDLPVEPPTRLLVSFNGGPAGVPAT